jgi:hypothetical protein
LVDEADKRLCNVDSPLDAGDGGAFYVAVTTKTFEQSCQTDEDLHPTLDESQETSYDSPSDMTTRYLFRVQGGTEALRWTQKLASTLCQSAPPDTDDHLLVR